jgi:hypothetical protein
LRTKWEVIAIRPAVARMASRHKSDYPGGPMTPEEIRILRAMTPAQKLAAAEDMYRAARDIKAAALRQQHPDWSEEEVQRNVREIFLHGRT